MGQADICAVTRGLCLTDLRSIGPPALKHKHSGIAAQSLHSLNPFVVEVPKMGFQAAIKNFLNSSEIPVACELVAFS